MYSIMTGYFIIKLNKFFFAFRTCELHMFYVWTPFNIRKLFYQYLFLYSVLESYLSCWYRDEQQMN